MVISPQLRRNIVCYTTCHLRALKMVQTTTRQASLPTYSLRSTSRFLVTSVSNDLAIYKPSAISTKPSTTIPSGSWDSHMHIIGDPERYPLSKSARYVPTPRSVSQALSMESSLGVDKMVLVQPSIYGDDNSCLLDSLRTLGPKRARGVVVFDPRKVDVAELEKWHSIGVRGLRLNLKSIELNLGDEAFAEELQRYADAVRPLNWVLQLYVPMARLELVQRIADKLNITICLDHLACPDLGVWRNKGKMADPRFLPGWSSLLELISAGRTYVKVSAPYRLARETKDMTMLGAIVKVLSQDVVGRKRLIWASDWPHTRYEGLDIAPFTSQVIIWCDGDEKIKARLFRHNAAELWR